MPETRCFLGRALLRVKWRVLRRQAIRLTTCFRVPVAFRPLDTPPAAAAAAAAGLDDAAGRVPIAAAEVAAAAELESPSGGGPQRFIYKSSRPAKSSTGMPLPLLVLLLLPP